MEDQYKELLNDDGLVFTTSEAVEKNTETSTTEPEPSKESSKEEVKPFKKKGKNPKKKS